MKVRVLDQETGRYFTSEVYAVVNTGWYERRLVRPGAPVSDQQDCAGEFSGLDMAQVGWGFGADAGL